MSGLLYFFLIFINLEDMVFIDQSPLILHAEVQLDLTLEKGKCMGSIIR